MEELVDLIATDASASDVSDKIKDALMENHIDCFRILIDSCKATFDT